MNNMNTELNINFIPQNFNFVPHRGSDKAAGYDLKAFIEEEELRIWPHETVKINTGIKIAIPDYYCGLILPRSGLASKEGLRPANTPGLIDSDYRGSIIVALHNDSNEIRTIKKGERIAQLVIIPFTVANFIPVSDLDDTSRGANGFGSTGK